MEFTMGGYRILITKKTHSDKAVADKLMSLACRYGYTVNKISLIKALRATGTPSENGHVIFPQYTGIGLHDAKVEVERLFDFHAGVVTMRNENGK